MSPRRVPSLQGPITAVIGQGPIAGGVTEGEIGATPARRLRPRLALGAHPDPVPARSKGGQLAGRQRAARTAVLGRLVGRWSVGSSVVGRLPVLDASGVTGTRRSTRREPCRAGVRAARLAQRVGQVSLIFDDRL